MKGRAGRSVWRVGRKQDPTSLLSFELITKGGLDNNRQSVPKKNKVEERNFRGKDPTLHKSDKL